MRTEKILWVVNYPTLKSFVAMAQQADATAVAIRTDNDVEKAIPVFQGLGIKVYAWRWPSAHRDPAMREASHAADLFGAGLDGYFVDPEEAKGKNGKSKPNDWNQKGLEKLARDFCEVVTKAANGKSFGITSHYRGNKVWELLPWDVFIKYATVYLPQAYWHSDEGPIGHGPLKNYEESLQCWREMGANPKGIVPMAGEIVVSTDLEIGEHVKAAKKNGVTALHFYAAEKGVASKVWDAIAQA